MADYVVTLTGQDNLSGTIKQVKSELNDLGKTTSKIDKIDAKFNKIINSTAPLKKQLRDLKALMAQMNMDGLSNTEQYTRAAQEAGRIKDAMDDAAAATKRFSSDTRYLDASIQGLQGIAALGNVAAGTMGLLGVKSNEVQQAILGVQSALAILNGVQQVANVLNKDSVLMQTIKAAGLKKVTVATEEATAAQIKNNTAVLANPYVIAAGAVAALVAGLVVWASTMEDTTEEQEKLNGAADAFTEAANTQTGTLTSQVTAFESLKKIYDESGGSADVLTKKIINNKEAQRKAGITVKTVDDVHRLFYQHSGNYIEAATARANAFIAEQAAASFLGKTLEQLSEVYNKLMKGEEVNWKDIMAPIEKLFGKDKAREIIEQAGGKQMWDWLFSNLEVPEDQVADFMLKVDKLVQEEFFKTGPGKILADFQQKMLEQAEGATVGWADLLSNNDKEINSGSGSKSGGKGGSTNTIGDKKKQVVGLINSWEELIRKQKEAVNSAKTEKDLLKAQEELNESLKGYKEFKIRLGLEVDPEAEEAKKAADQAAKDYQEKIKKAFEEYVKLDVAYSSRPSVDSTSGLSSFQKTMGEFVDRNSLQGIETMMNYNDKLIDQLETLAQKYVDMEATSTVMYQSLIEWIKKLKEEQKDLGGQATTISENNKELEIQQKKFNGIVEAVGNVGQAFSTLGQMTEDKGINAAGIVAQAIAQLAMSYAYAVSDAGKELGWVGWLVAGTSGLATLIAMIAQLHSLTGYASGGIISGGSNYGDHILARVNAGEMVLNRKQQSNLFRAIESGNIGAGNTVLVPDFRIKGSDLYCSLRNYSKSVGKTGKITGIR